MAYVDVDATRCDGSTCCTTICRENVFELRAPARSLPLLARLKVRLHGGRQAFVARESACTGCMECALGCAEGAISVSPGARPGTELSTFF